MPATLYVAIVIKLSSNVVPAVPAAPNWSVSPEAGNADQLAGADHWLEVLPIQVSLAANAGGASQLIAPIEAVPIEAATTPERSDLRYRRNHDFFSARRRTL